MNAVFDSGPPPPCPAPFNMAGYILAPAARLPDKIALAVVGPAKAERWSYGRLEAAVRGTATGLLRLGLAPGDRVLMRLGNCLEFPITYLAAITAGLVPVPTSAQLTRREITDIATELNPALIVAENGIALPVAPDCPVLPVARLAGMRDLPSAAYAMGDPARPAYIIYTSGTAGHPRGVIHAHRAIWARRMMHRDWYGLTETDRVLHAGALNWTYTLGTGLTDPWSVGATALVPAAGVAPETLGLLLKRHDVTLFAAAPGIYRQILRGALPDLPKLRHGLSAGEKLPEATRTAWLAATGTVLHEAFGMSECSTFISSSPQRPAPEGTLGFPQPGRRIAIVGDAGPVPRGTAGTIAVARRDPGLMLGYLDDNAAEDRYRGEWFLTGDTGMMDEAGAITYLGRADDMMNAGGFRVSPIEVETAMRTCPGITDCAATEVTVKAGTSVIALFYTGPAPLPEPVLQAHAGTVLARYKQPRLFVHRDSLPRGANNKLSRKALRREWSPPADRG